jgi:hypothetical protein|tara:strand:+ start:724 stop:1119 length:396 start_codon:yes stop_codon:yes gene_type:complete
MKNKLELIDKLALIALAFFALMFCSSINAQSYTVTKIDNNYEISFIDEFADQWYLDGEAIVVYGELNLNEKDYKQLIKDIKKTFKQSEKELIRPNYELIKYSWVKDSVWIYWKEKAFSVTKGDIKYLNSKL